MVPQQIYCAHHYMSKAISAIDETFGEGYAKAHPELIESFMLTAGLVDISQVRTDHPLMGCSFDGIVDALQSIAERMAAK